MMREKKRILWKKGTFLSIIKLSSSMRQIPNCKTKPDDVITESKPYKKKKQKSKNWNFSLELTQKIKVLLLYNNEGKAEKKKKITRNEYEYIFVCWWFCINCKLLTTDVVCVSLKGRWYCVEHTTLTNSKTVIIIERKFEYRCWQIQRKHTHCQHNKNIQAMNQIKKRKKKSETKSR